ncbi:MAG: alpha/beta hydrolase [Verrucomicrobiales bacterium]|nr:alpha/beta hydrolase [Verrucomicrobiales bacterium]
MTSIACGQTREPDAFWDYKTTESRTLRLHVFFPEGYRDTKPDAERFPVYVIFHGGGWGGGSPTTHYAECSYWSKRGMVSVAPEYRLKKKDNVEVPLECVKDAKSAIRHLRINATALKLDPDRFVVAGASAGGQLAAATSLIHSPETNDGVYAEDIATTANALILFNPWFKCEPGLSPPHFVGPGLPPCIIFLGDQDPGISVESLEGYHKDLKAAGNDSEYYVAFGGSHGFCNGRSPANRYFYWSLKMQDRFLVKHGILTGNDLVEVPEKFKDRVKELTEDDFKAY